MLFDLRPPQHHVRFDIVVIQGLCATCENIAVRRKAQRIEMHNVEIDRCVPVRGHAPGVPRQQPSDRIRMGAHQATRGEPGLPEPRAVGRDGEKLNAGAVLIEMFVRSLESCLDIAQQLCDDLPLHESQQVNLMHAGQFAHEVIASLQHPQAGLGVRYEVGKP